MKITLLALKCINSFSEGMEKEDEKNIQHIDLKLLLYESQK